jgi:hypothetical protein
VAAKEYRKGNHPHYRRNEDAVRQAARGAHVLLRDKTEMAKEGYVDHACFPSKRIRDGLQFTTKAESRLLQVADACARGYPPRRK